MTQTAVLLLRLATGEDIVGMVSETKSQYEIISPFKVIFRRLHKKAVGLSIVPWLPDELLENHLTRIAKSHVVCVTTPKKEFVDYYHRISDDFYMTLIDLDQQYRKQLLNLDLYPLPGGNASSTQDLMSYAYGSSFDEDFADEMDEMLDREDEPPTFH